MAERKRKKPARDDDALRRSWLELYAARDARQRLSRINSDVGIRQETLEAWLADPDFLVEKQRIDARRLEAALSLPTTAWPRILENQVALAAGDPEPPPADPGEDFQRRAVLEAYRAREAKRVAMSTRAAELLADIIGARKKRSEVEISGAGDIFGGIPEAEAELLADNRRMDAILKRAEARAKAAAKAAKKTT